MAKTQNTTAPKSVVEEARAFVQLCIDADSHNRVAAQDDLRFSAGDQWPAAIKQQRMLDRRPCLTIDKTDTFVRSVVNNMRQQRPRIKVHPVSDGADQAVSEVIQGLTRHIEVSSNADVAYDTAADYQVRMGWGYWRVLSKYIDEKSWEQELCVDRIRNPFSVYYDPSSTSPDGSDAKRCAITGKITLDEFRRKYEGKQESSWTLVGPGDDIPRKDEIMLVEFLRLDEKPAELCRLSDGSSQWKSDLPSEDEMKAKGLLVIDTRTSMRTTLKWSLCSGAEELKSQDLPGKYLTVIPCYGAELIDNGKVNRFGMVRKLKDPQMQYNFWRTSQTEVIALAPKSPWLMAEGQDEGHEEEWDNANVKNYSSLKYKPVTVGDQNTPLPPPQRQQPQAVPEASVSAAMAASEDLKAVAGMFDPSLGAPGQETSGTMVAKRQQQSDLSNFHFYDNLTRSIRQTGIVLLDLIPHYYDTKRVIRIIGEDGTPDSVTINDNQAVGKVLNDLSVGRYDVVMDTGPGYDTKRLEARDAMMALVTAFPKVAEIGGDLIVRQFDAPGMEALADRLEAAIPAAQIDKQLPKDLDPKARQMIGGLMAQMQQLKQANEELQREKDAKIFGVEQREHAVTVREMHKEDEETRRLQIIEAGKDKRETQKLHGDMLMNDDDNSVSLTETRETLAANLELGHMKAQQHGVPNNNRPTNQQ
jgi:hypothetical protein